MPGTPGRAWRRGLLLGAHAALLLAWLWAQAESASVTVVATALAATAYVDGQYLTGFVPPTDRGLVGLYLGPRPTIGRPAPPLLRRLSRESAWSSVTVRRLDDGAVLLRRELAGGLAWLAPAAATEGIEEFGDATWRDYVVEAELLRGREQVGVEVNGLPASGALFLFRPEHRDAHWWEATPAGSRGPLATARYRAYGKPPAAALQDALRLVLWAYPYALALALVAGAAGGAGWLVGRRRARGALAGADEDEPVTVRDERPGESGGSTVASEQRPARRWARLATLGAGLVSLAGLAVGAYVAHFLLERIPHVQDSVAYYFQAKVFALGRLWVPVPELPEFFNHEFVVMYQGKWFAKYPPGHPALLLLGELAGAPWLVNPVAAGLSLFLLYLIGRRLHGPGTGLLAAVLGLASPFFIFMSGSLMAHPTGLLAVLAFVWLFLQAERWPRALAAGAALGLAFLVRPWSAVVIAAPFAVVALAHLARRPADGLRRYVPLLAGFLPLLGLWLAYNAALAGDPLKNPQELWWEFDRLGFGLGYGPYGHRPLDGLWNTSRNMAELLTHLFGWPPFLTLGFITLLFVAGRARRSDALLLAAFVALVAGYALWWADGIMYGPRFYYEGLGFLLLLTARGVVETASLFQRAAERWSRPRGARPGGWRARPGRAVPALLGAGVAGGLLGLLLLYNALYYLPGQWALYHGYNYVNRGPVAAVERAGIHNALVFAYVGEWFEWWNYGMVFSSNTPLLDGDVVYARDLGDEQNRKLMAQYPGRSYYRLRGTELTPVQ